MTLSQFVFPRNDDFPLETGRDDGISCFIRYANETAPH